jgi:predicted secreted protein
MADEDPITGVGTQFLRWNTATGAWEQITKVKNIGGPSKTRATVDTTTLDNTDKYRTFLPGFRDAGTVAMTLMFTRDGYEKLNNDFEDDDPQNYQIVLTDEDETSLEFEGLVTELPLTIPEDAVTFNCTIKISGKVEIESGSQTGSAVE